MPGQDAENRKRGRIEKRGNSLRVRVYAGDDPVTGRRVYRSETVPGTDRAAEKRAQKALTRLLAEVNAQRASTSTVALSYVLAEWLRVAELEATTRRTYVGYNDRTIVPAIGGIAAARLTARTLETLYGELRRCRSRCDVRVPFVEHRAEGDHDCAESKCRPHVCGPMAASTVRQIHSIISAALSAAVRWEWISSNPAQIAVRPRAKAPEPDPPSPAEAARLIDAAFAMDADWGVLVWFVMTTGVRRGEVCASRWSDIDFDAETVAIRRSYVLHKGVGVEKDTKTHQMRRIALDSETVALLRDQRGRVEASLTDLGVTFSERTYVFSSVRTPDHRVPYSPHAVSSRYKEMAERLGSGRTCTRSGTTRRRNSSLRALTCALSPDVWATAEVGRRHSASTRRGSRRPTGRRRSCSVPGCRSAHGRRRRPEARMADRRWSAGEAVGKQGVLPASLPGGPPWLELREQLSGR